MVNTMHLIDVIICHVSDLDPEIHPKALLSLDVTETNCLGLSFLESRT